MVCSKLSVKGYKYSINEKFVFVNPKKIIFLNDSHLCRE